MPQAMLEPSTHSRIDYFATLAGITSKKAINDAVNEWMDTTGEPLQDEILRRRAKMEKRKSTKKLSTGENNASNSATKSCTISSIDDSPRFKRKRKPPVAASTGTAIVVSQSA